MTTSPSTAEQRAATRKALARKAAAAKKSSGGATAKSPTAADRSRNARPTGRTPSRSGVAVAEPTSKASVPRADSRLVATPELRDRERRGARPPRGGAAPAPETVETIQVGGRRANRSRFNSPDGRRLLVTPRLRRLDGGAARRPDHDDPVHGAPFVAPSNPIGRRVVRRRWERRGFVPVSPGRPRLRHRILPRTVIGICTLLVAFAVGVGFSGAAFYAYYDQRLAQNEEAVSRFVDGFDRQFTDAVGTMDDLRVQAVSDIRDELTPLGELAADANGVATLPATAGPSVWQIETRDETGQVVAGAAFAVAPHDDGTAFVTSYALVMASTTAPSPTIELAKGDQKVPAQLWAWDAERDLALLVADVSVPPLLLASDTDQVAAVGARVFVLSGVGGQGATASPGVLLDHAQNGLQHTAAVGTLFQGGPLLTGEGRVIGMASLAYRPNGVDPGQVLQAPDVTALCAKVLTCVPTSDAMSIGITADTSQVPAAGSPASDTAGALPSGGD